MLNKSHSQLPHEQTFATTLCDHDIFVCYFFFFFQMLSKCDVKQIKYLFLKNISCVQYYILRVYKRKKKSRFPIIVRPTEVYRVCFAYGIRIKILFYGVVRDVCCLQDDQQEKKQIEAQKKERAFQQRGRQLAHTTARRSFGVL